MTSDPASRDSTAAPDADRAVLSWSGGKDAALALSAVREARAPSIDELLTTVTAAYDRSSMHGVRRSLYDRQAAALGLPIEYVELPTQPSNETYESIMAEATATYVDRGFDRIVFGDIHLEDVRAYREARLEVLAIDGCWPLWGRDTTDLVESFLAAGFRATVVAVDGDALDASYAGRDLDQSFLADLPPGVDPCGENGEFHTFVRDGPMFAEPVPVATGDRVTNEVGDGVVHYCDLRSPNGR